MQSTPTDDLARSVSQLSASVLHAALMGRDDVRLLKRLTQPELSPFPPEEPGHLIILDTESTGTNPRTDELVELGMLKVLYCRRSLRLCAVVDRYNGLRDPGVPMPPAAAKVNGLTDEVLAGQAIDFDEVAAFVDDADWVIAHNATFDRPLVERYCPVFMSKAWACSRQDIDWAAVGIGGTKLDYIAFRLGFFYDAHRATVDCEALLQMLASMVENESGPTTPFEMLLASAREASKQVYAFGAPFEKKDVLRERSYRWHAGETAPEKSWYVVVKGDAAFNTEIAWLKESVYARRSCCIGVMTLGATSRYSGQSPKVERVFV